MTSRQSIERTERTEPRRTTVRRGLKKRGVLPSFGDMMLPIVSVFAVILLVIAGRQFFLNGLKTSPGITSTKAYAEAPAIIAELERKAEPEAVAKIPEPVSDEIEAKSEPEEDLFALAVAVQQPKTQKTEVKKSAPVQTTKKPTTAKSSSNTAVKKTTTPAKAQTGSSSVNSKQWRVQIGAYTNKAGAQDAANKIKKAGYNAVVYSNPASKHYKVWVQGGADKKAADNVVKAMQKLGYKSSFSFPPAK
ncbi:MAG: SPOR domain-containing protein [Synergistaceae bacterium]|nr:SPOR domain-containing protein [Synergistaceae bacterium]